MVQSSDEHVLQINVDLVTFHSDKNGEIKATSESFGNDMIKGGGNCVLEQPIDITISSYQPQWIQENSALSNKLIE